ncbi:MAG: hypothetical protein PHD76_14870 [Methylacidiphilales bacterium]|nr:hypothetical protein [Candidatus Methylacidiphilales bacterium]
MNPIPDTKKLNKRLPAGAFIFSLLFHVVILVWISGVILIKRVDPAHAFGEYTPPAENVDETPPAEPKEETPPEPNQASTPTPDQPATPTMDASPNSNIIAAETPTTDNFNVQPIVVAKLSQTTGDSSDASQQKGLQKAGAGALGKLSSFSFMGIKADSRRVVFLLDTSGSMILEKKGGGKSYAALKDELVKLVDGLDQETEFNVIMFGDGGCDTFQPKAVDASDENVADFKKWLDPYMKDKAGMRRINYYNSYAHGISGTTRLDIALTAAFKMQAETVFILTDGTPSVRVEDDKDYIKKVEEFRIKNKDLYEKYDAEVKEFMKKYPDELQQAQKKAAEKNSALSGRTQEAYWWLQYSPHYPRDSPDHRPDYPKRSKPPYLVASDFNQMLRDMQKEIYEPINMPMPAINIIGYYVDDTSENYLKEMLRGIPGKYRTFKK